MDAKNIIQEKIKIITDEVEHLLSEYRAWDGERFQDVEKLKNVIKKELWAIVENYETPEKLPVDCKVEFLMDGNRYHLMIKERETRITIYGFTSDLVDGYDEETGKKFDAYEGEIMGTFVLKNNNMFYL